MTLPKSSLGGSPFPYPGQNGAIFLRSRLRRSRNPCHSLAGGAPKNEPFVRKRSWRILSVKGRTSLSELGLECKPKRQNIDIHLNRRTSQLVTDKMACFVSPRVKIRRALEDTLTHAQARNFAERSTNASSRYVFSFSEYKLAFWSASWNTKRLEREILYVKLMYIFGFQILYRKAFSPSRTQCYMHMTLRTWGYRVILIREVHL